MTITKNIDLNVVASQGKLMSFGGTSWVDETLYIIFNNGKRFYLLDSASKERQVITTRQGENWLVNNGYKNVLR